jgi:hypothetical protein
MDYEGFFRRRLGALHAEGGTVCLPISNGVAAAFRAPSTAASAPK